MAVGYALNKMFISAAKEVSFRIFKALPFPIIFLSTIHRPSVLVAAQF